MGRYVDDLPAPRPDRDVAADLADLRGLGMAGAVDGPFGPTIREFHRRKSEIVTRLGRTEEAFAEVWAVLEELRMADWAARHLAYMRSFRGRWGNDNTTRRST